MRLRYLMFIFLLLCGGNLIAETKIEKINFRGNTFRDSQTLRGLLRSQQGETFEPRLVKLDKILLTNFYRKNGYLTISVSDSIIMGENQEEARLIYHIQEGQRYYYGGVRFSGQQEITEVQLKKSFNKIEPLSPFDESKIKTARQQVENLYYNSGKPFVQITYDYRFEQDSLVFAVFDIVENQTVFIKDIKYTGLKLVQKFLIRRELELTKGDRYSRKKLEYSQQNIYGTGLFKYVRFEIEPIEDQPERVILYILVQEKDARWVGFQLGVAHEQDEFYGNKFDLHFRADIEIFTELPEV